MLSELKTVLLTAIAVRALPGAGAAEDELRERHPRFINLKLQLVLPACFGI